jgi:hypothetical protein
MMKKRRLMEIDPIPTRMTEREAFLYKELRQAYAALGWADEEFERMFPR